MPRVKELDKLLEKNTIPVPKIINHLVREVTIVSEPEV